MKRNCLQCNIEFSVPGTNPTKRFCSKQCSASFHHKGKKKSTLPCHLCYREISKSNFEKHTKVCNGTLFYGPVNPSKHTFSLPPDCFTNNKWHCPDCEQTFNSQNGLISHYWSKHTEEGRQFRTDKLNGHDPNIGFKNGTRTQWNTGLKKDTDERVASISETRSRKYQNGEIPNYFADVSQNPELKRTWTKRRRVFEYNGIIMDSGYEVEVAKQLDANNIEWYRPNKMYWICANNKKHSYVADFYLPQFNVYLDPKNDLLIVKHADKIRRVSEQNDVIILVISSKELKWPIIKQRIERSRQDSNLE